MEELAANPTEYFTIFVRQIRRWTPDETLRNFKAQHPLMTHFMRSGNNTNEIFWGFCEKNVRSGLARQDEQNGERSSGSLPTLPQF